MFVAEKSFLHEAIDNFSPKEINFLIDIVQDMLSDSLIDELPENEIPEHLAILEEMKQGNYVLLEDLKI